MSSISNSLPVWSVNVIVILSNSVYMFSKTLNCLVQYLKINIRFTWRKNNTLAFVDVDCLPSCTEIKLLEPLQDFTSFYRFCFVYYFSVLPNIISWLFHAFLRCDWYNLEYLTIRAIRTIRQFKPIIPKLRLIFWILLLLHCCRIFFHV